MPRSLSVDSSIVTDVQLDEDHNAGPQLRAALHGDIELSKSPKVRQTLLELVKTHKPVLLILDLTDVPYMDSSGIAVLVEVLKALRENDGKMKLTGASKRVRGLLEISRLDSLFEIESAAER